MIAIESWIDALRDRPAASVVSAAALLAAAVAVAYGVRRVSGRITALRTLVLLITLASLVIGAVAAVLLARLMVLDTEQMRTTIGVIAITAVLATVLALVASAPLGRDVKQLEETVRRLEHGDRTARTGFVRADELGHVGRALDELAARLDVLELERAGVEEERRAMITSVGHDLRTPLTALRAGLEALMDGVAPDPERYLRAMLRDVEALGSLVDDLFLLARIEAGRLDLERQAVDLSELADEAVEALSPAAAAAGVLLTLCSPGGVPATASPTAVGRVIRNLVDNAIRHAPSGSQVEVEVSGTGAPTVIVTDAGPGFPDGFTSHAFERFARADPSRTRATGGAGLGLAIARGLVEAHGGRIWIGEGSGGRVGFEIPSNAQGTAVSVDQTRQ